jgi:hypothetical protein
MAEAVVLERASTALVSAGAKLTVRKMTFVPAANWCTSITIFVVLWKTIDMYTESLFSRFFSFVVWCRRLAQSSD